MKSLSLALTATFLMALSVFAGAGRGCSAGDFVAFPESGQTFALRRNNAGYLELSFGGWGLNWSWSGLKDKVSQSRGKTRAVCTGKVNTGAEITLAATIEKSGPRQDLLLSRRVLIR